MTPGQEKERRDAEDFGFELIPRSGGDRKNPGDSKSKTPYWLCDSKHTDKQGFRVTTTHLRKLMGECIQQKREFPLLSPEIEDNKGKIEFVVLLKSDFIYIKEMFERYKDLQKS